MKNIIATWVCIDDKTNGTYFPSAKGNSADHAVQEIYWRCICTFFWTARFYNPDTRLVLFSNQFQLPEVENVSVEEILKKLGVQFYTTPFEYVTPPGYYGEWRNQFYEFSIFDFVSNHGDFDEKDRFVLLDSDCIIMKDLDALFKIIGQKNCITYEIDYLVEHTINGNSRKDMKLIFEELLSTQLEHYPAYHGGEFFAADIQTIKKLIADFKAVWQQLLMRHATGLPKLNEEAHVLSYLFFKNGVSGGEANIFIKRLWTDPSTYRNVTATDTRLMIWHLPAEKRKGFKSLFNFLKSINFNINSVNSETLQKRLRNTFLVPTIPIHKQPYYITKKLVKKILG